MVERVKKWSDWWQKTTHCVHHCKKPLLHDNTNVWFMEHGIGLGRALKLYSSFTITGSYFSCLASSRINAGVWGSHYNLLIHWCRRRFPSQLPPPPQPPHYGLMSFRYCWFNQGLMFTYVFVKRGSVVSEESGAPSKSRAFSAKSKCPTICSNGQLIERVSDYRHNLNQWYQCQLLDYCWGGAHRQAPGRLWSKPLIGNWPKVLWPNNLWLPRLFSI